MDVAETISRSFRRAEGYLQLGLGEAALPIVVSNLTRFPEAFDEACLLYGWAKHLTGDLKTCGYALDQVLEAARSRSGSHSLKFMNEYTRLIQGCVDWDPDRYVANSEMIGLFPAACMRAILGTKEDALALLAERRSFT